MKNHLYIECVCHSKEHMAVLCTADEDGETRAWFEFQLSHHLGFWGRVRAGLRFIVQRRRQCMWDTLELTNYDAMRIRSALQDVHTHAKEVK